MVSGEQPGIGQGSDIPHLGNPQSELIQPSVDGSIPSVVQPMPGAEGRVIIASKDQVTHDGLGSSLRSNPNPRAVAAAIRKNHLIDNTRRSSVDTGEATGSQSPVGFVADVVQQPAHRDVTPADAQRARRVDQRSTDGLSNLEKVFGFEDPSFQRYIKMKSTKHISSGGLIQLSSEMSEHSHPLVRYASGWAAAEAGMLRIRERDKNKERGDSLPGRLKSLETAERIWHEVGEGFKEARGKTRLFDEKADLLRLELRAEQAIAYLPSLQLTAMLMSGHEVTEQDRDELLKKTQKGLIKLSKKVIDLRTSNKQFNNSLEFATSRSGMCNEMISGLLLQTADSPQFVIIPASLRQDHNSRSLLRADLVAVSIGSAHPKTLIQITSSQDVGRSKGRVLIRASEDLALPGLRPRDTLRRFIDREEGEVPPEMSSRLDALSQTLRDRLAAFTPA